MDELTTPQEARRRVRVEYSRHVEDTLSKIADTVNRLEVSLLERTNTLQVAITKLETNYNEIVRRLTDLEKDKAQQPERAWSKASVIIAALGLTFSFVFSASGLLLSVLIATHVIH